MIVDSFIRFHAADENSATEMGRVMTDLRLWRMQGLRSFCSTTSQRLKARNIGGVVTSRLVWTWRLPWHMNVSLGT